MDIAYRYQHIQRHVKNISLQCEKTRHCSLRDWMKEDACE